MLSDPTFWVAVAFFVFVGIVVYYKIPGKVAAALDSRANLIAKELDEARKLREEAQAFYAAIQRKQRDAEKEAQEIVNQARIEADHLTNETRKALEAQLARRTKLAEDKIAQAEAQAIADVKAMAAEVAVAAARRVIADQMDGARANALIDKSIAELKSKLN